MGVVGWRAGIGPTSTRKQSGGVRASSFLHALWFGYGVLPLKSGGQKFFFGYAKSGLNAFLFDAIDTCRGAGHGVRVGGEFSAGRWGFTLAAFFQSVGALGQLTGWRS